MISAKKAPHQKTKCTQALRNRGNDKQNVLLKTISLLERDLGQLSKINELYHRQIQELERDNLCLFQRMQQQKKREAELESYYQLETNKTRQQNAQLTRIISFLEEQIRSRDIQRCEIVARNQHLSKNTRQTEEMILQMAELQTDIDRYKIKYLESQKYWMTRSQALLSSKQAEDERILMERETSFNLQLKQARQQIVLKDSIIAEKTEEIYKLIHHIQKDF